MIDDRSVGRPILGRRPVETAPVPVGPNPPGQCRLSMAVTVEKG
jgi:hypothetical protein